MEGTARKSEKKREEFNILQINHILLAEIDLSQTLLMMR